MKFIKENATLIPFILISTILGYLIVTNIIKDKKIEHFPSSVSQILIESCTGVRQGIKEFSIVRETEKFNVVVTCNFSSPIIFSIKETYLIKTK